MRNFFIFIFIISLAYLNMQNNCFANPISGTVEKEKYLEQNRTSTVVDISSGRPVSNAIVSIPAKGVTTRTDQNGRFGLNANLGSPAILSVKADGYKPFSLTVSQDSLGKPLTLGISKQTGKEIIIDSNLHHLGDDNFSQYSANANDFHSRSDGANFSKEFYVENVDKNKDIVLKIGSAIGIDTEIARRLRQNRITSSVSSPTKIYINSQKIGELRINGDNQEMVIYPQFLMPNSYNQITVETGRNLNSLSKVDYDDMEFMNLILEFR